MQSYAVLDGFQTGLALRSDDLAFSTKERLSSEKRYNCASQFGQHNE